MQSRAGSFASVGGMGFPVRFQQGFIVFDLSMPGTKGVHERFKLCDLGGGWIKVQAVICQGFPLYTLGWDGLIHLGYKYIVGFHSLGRYLAYYYRSRIT